MVCESHLIYLSLVNKDRHIAPNPYGLYTHRYGQVLNSYNYENSNFNF